MKFFEKYIIFKVINMKSQFAAVWQMALDYLKKEETTNTINSY